MTEELPDIYGIKDFMRIFLLLCIYSEVLIFGYLLIVGQNRLAMRVVVIFIVIMVIAEIINLILNWKDLKGLIAGMYNKVN